MGIELRSSATREEIDKALSRLRTKRKAINLDKYFGKIKFNTGGLAYQKKVRNEWR